MSKKIEEINPNKMYLVTIDGDIYEDEYDYLQSLQTEDYTGIKDSYEEWENQQLEENTAWILGKELLEMYSSKFEEKRLKKC